MTGILKNGHTLTAPDDPIIHLQHFSGDGTGYPSPLHHSRDLRALRGCRCWRSRFTVSPLEVTDQVKQRTDVVYDDHTGGSKLWFRVKMLLVVAVPLITMIAVSGVVISGVVTNNHNAAKSIFSLDLFFSVDSLIIYLQIERGTAVAVASSNGDNLEAIDELKKAKVNTDNALHNLFAWPSPADVNDAEFLKNKSTLMSYLSLCRSVSYNDTDNDIRLMLNMYNNITELLIGWAQSLVFLPNNDNIWSMVVVADSLIRASDALGLQRALGLACFSSCKLSSDDSNWFLNLQGASNELMAQAFLYDQAASDAYESSYTNTDLERNISMLLSQIKSGCVTGLGVNCGENMTSLRYNVSNTWWRLMTKYIDVIILIRHRVISDVINSLNSALQESKIQLIIYCLVLSFVTLCCLMITLWYSSRIQGILAEMAAFSSSLQAKSIELEAERTRADSLLYQLMPKEVADRLKMKKEVKAKHYECVTVYFSDIVGFTEISSRSQPIDIVNMLNLLYSTFDESIDRYRVYKVETIGDSYMFVGGLPIIIPDHASEVARLAIELQLIVSNFKIPHMPDEILRLRAGIHSGAVVAGVVGLKMPRYCLFGDTVNTASRMETTGLANRIHLSESARSELIRLGGFLIEIRGTINVKGKGLMNTYWLNGFSDYSASSL